MLNCKNQDMDNFLVNGEEDKLLGVQLFVRLPSGRLLSYWQSDIFF